MKISKDKLYNAVSILKIGDDKNHQEKKIIFYENLKSLESDEYLLTMKIAKYIINDEIEKIPLNISFY